MNEWGVLVPDETVVLADGPGFRAEAYLASHDGRWWYGLDCKVGGIEVDSVGFGWWPSPREASYETREAAIRAARLACARRVVRHVVWMRSGGRAGNPSVLRACAAIVAALEQMPLLEA
ncbi:hypothetical protein G3N55_00160 [Dissulfurirhabdus thermomarina]|uniref:Uncharacterized protein n=1 Tax=Dissulfurirhabdus thermomarina TaxID=1765737 RepID=A0A6N9TMG3_DISTH|nr:hypothetical protein [Dissulfurirhabdus thermomarina]NDY41263.1 hypothetical protein [Dissulfurirhabdus thermomarina]